MNPRSPTSASKPSFLAALGLALLVFVPGFAIVYALLGAPSQGIDDADITMVYARNIAAGHGYVYSPGGERVEGSTSLTWTLLCTGLYALGAQTMLPMLVLGGALTIASVAFGALICQQVGTDERRQLLAWYAGLLLICPAFFAWSGVTLMDVSIWSASIVLAMLFAISKPSPLVRIGFCTACALLVLTRPEGLLIAPTMVCIASVVHFARGASLSESLRFALAPGLVVVLTIVGAFAFRIAYFGYPFPNTYYVKIGSDRAYTALRGGRYLLKLFYRQPLHLVTLVLVVRSLAQTAPALWSRFRGSRATLEASQLVAFALALLLGLMFVLPLLEGEDHFAGLRMIQPFVPLACAFLALECVRLGKTWLRGRGRQLLVALAVLGCVGWVQFVRELEPLRWELDLAANGRAMAKALEAQPGLKKSLPSVGVAAAGGFAYEYDGRTQDMLGLNWLAMAHSSGERHGIAGHAAFSERVFWSDAPDLMMVYKFDAKPRDTCGLDFWLTAIENHMYKGLVSTRRFRDAYQGFALPYQGVWIAGFARRDWLKQGLLGNATTLEWPARGVDGGRCFASQSVPSN